MGLQESLDVIVRSNYVKVQGAITDLLEDEPQLEATAAFVEAMAQRPDPSACVKMRLPERLACSRDHSAYLLALVLVQSAQRGKKIRVEISRPEGLRCCL